MNMELHAKGASFISTQTEDNPRDIIVELLQNRPNEDRKVLFESFCEEIEIDSNNKYQRAIAWYFFVNMSDYLITSRNRPKAPGSRATAQAAQRETIERIKGQIVMLDFLMPIGDGKPMRDCTGAEMARLGNRYQKIADKVGKTKTVGEVLSEEQVRTLMK